MKAGILTQLELIISDASMEREHILSSEVSNCSEMDSTPLRGNIMTGIYDDSLF